MITLTAEEQAIWDRYVRALASGPGRIDGDCEAADQLILERRKRLAPATAPATCGAEFDRAHASAHVERAHGPDGLPCVLAPGHAELHRDGNGRTWRDDYSHPSKRGAGR